MKSNIRIYLISALGLLLSTLFFGLLATWAFLYPEVYNKFLPFYQLRPFHVSAALFWIITGATASILFYKNETVAKGIKSSALLETGFIVIWLSTIAAIFICYGLKIFGGREYWEFPPILCLPLLISWILLMFSFYVPLFKNTGKKPMYIWMWATGILFFLITFVEQNLWQIAWFRASYLKEITVQWKSNGAMVGAWNQMIYGTSLYLMVKISGDETIAKGKTAFFFYMLGLTNLMFNWGHHIYNVPTASWIRDTSYVISMTEWVFLIRMIQSFKKTLEQRAKLRHLLTYRFIIAAEFWVFMNLLLTLSISVPAINLYTHGTHITVAHAMGATIGINSMLLLASFTYMLKIDNLKGRVSKFLSFSYWVSQFSLGCFWIALIVAGFIKGYRTVENSKLNFQEIMEPVLKVMKVFSYAGVFLVISIASIVIVYLYNAIKLKQYQTQIEI